MKVSLHLLQAGNIGSELIWARIGHRGCGNLIGVAFIFCNLLVLFRPAVGPSFFAPVNKTATDAFSASETQPRLSIIGQHGQQGINHITLDDRRAD
jgi:hypothetical protein